MGNTVGDGVGLVVYLGLVAVGFAVTGGGTGLALGDSVGEGVVLLVEVVGAGVVELLGLSCEG